MGQVFGSGVSGGAGLIPMYSSRQHRKNNLFEEDFKEKVKIAKKKKVKI